MTDAPGPFGPLSRDDRLPLERGPSLEALVASDVATLGGVHDTLLRVSDALVHAGESTLEGDTAGDFAQLVGEVDQGDADAVDRFWQDIVDNGDTFAGHMNDRAAELPPDDTLEAETLPPVDDLGFVIGEPEPPAPGPPPAPEPPPPGGGGGGGGLTEADAITLVTSWYRDTLDRDPDPDGLAVWVELLIVRHQTIASVHAQFLAAAAAELASRESP